MNNFCADLNGKVHLINLYNGEDVLLEICKFVKCEGIRNGIVLTGLGTLQQCSFHGVIDTNLPAKDAYYCLNNQPIEFSGLSGIIADYEPHLHMCFTSFQGEYQSCIAHMEPGCLVLCLCEISILELDNVQMYRQIDKNSIKQLTGNYLRDR